MPIALFATVVKARQNLLFSLLKVIGLMAAIVVSFELFASSPPVMDPRSCQALLGPVLFDVQSNQLYGRQDTKRWELNNDAHFYRHATARVSRAPHVLVEAYNTALDIGPSRNWIQTLTRLGLMPREFSDLRNFNWDDIDRYIEMAGFHPHSHQLREDHLKANRADYLKNVTPGFDLAMREYVRRKWFTPEFRVGAEETFHSTLENANYILVRNPNNPDEVWGALRLVRVHTGKLTLTDKQTGRKLEILGNAEIGWGVDGTHRLGRESFRTAFEVEKQVAEFLNSNDPLVRAISGDGPIDFIKMPMELSLSIEVPRNYERVDLTRQSDFAGGATMIIGGREFALEYEHAVAIEPGLFVIDKTKDKVLVFSEMMLWLNHVIANPLLPQWIDEKKIGYWTYNDLPLYKPFGFEVDAHFQPIHKYGVKWDIYSATPQKMYHSIKELVDARTKGSARWLQMRQFLDENF